MSAIYGKLLAIQGALKAPKNQYNSFGKYNYRSCEDILEAVKPLAQAQGCVVTLSDEAVVVDGWHYIKAVAELLDKEGGVAAAWAYAREPESKKGMDASQVTGTASSYARKYALSGLFALDDTKDADGQNNQGAGEPKQGAGAAKLAPAKQTSWDGKPTSQEPKYCCADCGKPFVTFTDRQGEVWSPLRQYEVAVKISGDGKARCRACRDKQAVSYEQQN